MKAILLSLHQKFVAEFIATFMLTFSVGLALSTGAGQVVPFIAAMVVGLFVYTIGAISGAHINPAVTIGLYSIKKMKHHDAVVYLISQFLGAIVAIVVIGAILPGSSTGVQADDSLLIVIAEFLGAAFLVFGISSVVYKRAHEAASGLVIGGSLLIGIFAAGLIGSNGVLNPAVAIGISSVSLSYLVAPIVGGVAGAWLGRYIHEK